MLNLISLGSWSWLHACVSWDLLVLGLDFFILCVWFYEVVVNESMAVVSKSGYGVEGIVRSRSFKWVLWRRGWVKDDSGDTETGDAQAAGKSWITELSPFANVVVRRCSK